MSTQFTRVTYFQILVSYNIHFELVCAFVELINFWVQFFSISLLNISMCNVHLWNLFISLGLVLSDYTFFFFCLFSFSIMISLFYIISKLNKFLKLYSIHHVICQKWYFESSKLDIWAINHTQNVPMILIFALNTLIFSL